MWIKPVFDRTQQDVDEGRPGGFCNAVDLNRLEGNCRELAGLLEITLPIRGSPWTEGDLPTVGELERITENIRKLDARHRAYQTTPSPPQNPLNHWRKWNDGEKILMDIKENHAENKAARGFGGEIFAGERIGVL